VVRREDLPAKAPLALSEEQQRRLLRVAERASARNRAIVVMLLYTGLRLAELDVDDARMSARKGLLIVLSTRSPGGPGTSERFGLYGRSALGWAPMA
jgi:site-specific recombinase XerC